MGIFKKIIGVVIGVALVVAGVLTGNPMLIIQGGVIILGSLLAPKVKGPARTAQETTLQLGEQPRVALFGKTAITGSLVDAFNYGGKYNTDWEVLVIRLADHKCHSLVGFYVNDEYVAYAGNGNYPQFDTDHFELYFRSDTTTQTITSLVTTHGTGWTAADKGESGCDVVVAYRADAPDAKHPAWPGGRPRLMFVVKGKYCYDPRKDSTVTGGSGTHRWDDPSTWEWSENAIVCRYNYVRGIYANDDVSDPAALLVGRGLTAEEAPPENMFAPANLCDEVVDGVARYTCSGPVYSNQEFIEVEEEFAFATGGTIVTRQGSVEIEPGQAKAVVAHFTDDDLLVGKTVKYNQQILSQSDTEWVNSVVARYVEPTQRWADHAAPIRRDTADIVADGKPREAQITLHLVAVAKQAGRIAEITRRLGRIWGRAEVSLGPRFCELEDGDWVNWTSERRFGGATKTFRVEAYQIDKEWKVQLALREINSTVYSDGAFIVDQAEANPSDVPGDIGAPDSGSWTLTSELLTSSVASVPILVIAGAVEDPAAEAVRFEYWLDDGVIDPTTEPDDPDWINVGTFSPGVTRREIGSIQSGADYYAAVTYLVQGIPGDRLVLGPVTAGALDVSGQAQSMADMPTIYVDADYTGAINAGELPLTIQARRYSGGVDVSADATWSATVASGAITITDLTPDGGGFEVTDLDATATLTVSSTYNGVTLNKTQVVELRLSAPPSTGTTSDSTFNAISSASMAAITDELTITVGASGTVTLTAPLTVKTAKTPAGGPFPVYGIWRWWNGSSWTDLGTEVESDPDCDLEEISSDPVKFALVPGTLNVPASKGSLTPGASEKFQLYARNASGTRTMTFVGTATAATS